ncbi:glycoside hydrolase family 13 protein [Rubricoccus marinus]|uniref:Glycosyl hydrolase family 13 catalytic domain-containing protein n=1 Tax=Rubricoccus marinus TaxID=716817 RepID=A0A259TUZ4_9BACT|nr:glycoside hydrolase family 13 protein [Rubricoccus marinus]OZC01589.1 hypothetical protein BSZ36_00465 [Rubricoccus marinus]
MIRSLGLALLLLATAYSPLAQPVPPDWAQGAVWYQIFPERFRNGDPSNDPTWASLDFNDRADSSLWRPSPWTGDWYARDAWEEDLGDDFYEDGVFFRRYGGDLQGVLEKVDYIADLGVDVVYFNPVFHAASLHKYDPTSFHHVDPYFGPDPDGDIALAAGEDPGDPATWVWTRADSLFLDVVRAFHARGVRVVLDGVFNHTGTRFWAFQDVRENGRASRYADWYNVTAWDDPATPQDEFDWEGWWGFKPLAVLADEPDLRPGVREHIFDITRRWMDPDGDGDPSDGIDGWRLDVADEVPAGFWRDWNAHVRSLNPEAVTVGEIWSPAAHFAKETEFTTVMGYSAFAIPVEQSILDGRVPLATFADTLTARQRAYPEATRHAILTLMGSHDTERLASMIVNAPLGTHFDQGSNPRQDERYAVRAPNAREREIQRMVVALQMTARGAPTIYYGDEAGIWGADDPDDRKPFPWPDLDMAPEATDPLGRARTPDPVAFDSSLWRFHREAIALRNEWDVLRRGDQRFLTTDDSTGTLAFERTLGTQRLIVALNRSDASQLIGIPGETGPLVPIFASRGAVRDIPALVQVIYEDDRTELGYRVPARSLVVYRPVRDADIRPRGLDE